MNLTPEQVAIKRYAHGSDGSLIVEALAGSGKTSTLIECLNIMPQASTLVLAFNKRIADEMARRLPKLPRHRIAHVKTLHATGNWIVNHHYRGLTVSAEITEQRIRDAAGKGTPLRVLGASTKLLRLVKDLQHERVLDLDAAHSIGYDFGCFDKLQDGHECQHVVEIVERAYRASLEVTDTIDFPDQGWLPLVLGLEPPHRYKAILLDEYQDVNPNQLAMVERLLAPGGRIIAAGDRNQAIYGWRGASTHETWDRLVDHYRAQSLPLTVTWRCDQAIVEEANQLVPDLKARPDAGRGVVEGMNETHFYSTVIEADGSVFVLSRTNAELLRVALEMWRRSIPFNLAQSNEVIGPLKGILQKLIRGDVRPGRQIDDTAIDQALSLFHMRRQQGEARAAAARTLSGAGSPPPAMITFKQALAAWYTTEMMKAQNAASSSWAERIDDQHRMILYCANYVRDPREIEPLLENIFLVDDTCWITLSTVHKAKGLEADHVYLLRETFARHQERRDRAGNLMPIDPEELNVEYVAITRARHTLSWVCLQGEDE